MTVRQLIVQLDSALHNFVAYHKGPAALCIIVSLCSTFQSHLSAPMRRRTYVLLYVNSCLIEAVQIP